MRKISYLRLVVSICGLLFMLPNQAFAGGGVSSLFTLTASASSATVGKSVTVYLYAYDYACNEGGSLGLDTKPFTCADSSQSYERPNPNDYYWVDVSGSDNTITGLINKEGHDSVQTGADGKASFTISSTKAETKTITVSNFYGFNPELNKSVNITFKDAVVAAPKSTPAPAPEAVVPAPDPPKASVEIQGKASTESTIALSNKQPLVLNGTAAANTTVTLYIFSDPKQATVTADANGNWTYTVSGLEPGNHHVEAEVTDPKTGKTSSRVTLATFSVAQPVKVAVVPKKVEAPSSSVAWPLFAVGAAAVAAIAGGVWWFIRRKKAASGPVVPADTLTQDHTDTNAPL